jgi:hypothetical protein
MEASCSRVDTLGDGSYPSRDSELFVDGISPPSSIRPGFTGSWYDPEQSDHGLLVEVLPNNQFLAACFAFNPTGTQ